MSLIRELIDEMRKKDNEREKADKEYFVEKDKEYNSLVEKNMMQEDKVKKSTESILSKLQQLNSFKHTIDKSLQENIDLTGLPVPYNDHKAFIKLVSDVHGVLNKPDIFSKSSTLPVEDIQNFAISTVESVASNLREYNTDLMRAEALYHNTVELKNIKNRETDDQVDIREKMSSTIIEESDSANDTILNFL